MDGYVDWFKVESLGGMGTYPNEKKLQLSMHPEPVELVNVKPSAPAVNMLEIMPGVYVKKVEVRV